MDISDLEGVEPVKLEIEAGDWEIRGFGRMVSEDSEAVGIDPDGALRSRAPTILLDITEGSFRYEREELVITCPLPPGIYYLDSDGLSAIEGSEQSCTDS